MERHLHRTIAFRRMAIIVPKVLISVVLLLVILPGGIFLELSAAAPAAAGKSMSVGIKIQAVPTLKLTAKERTSIFEKIKSVLPSIASHWSGWECVKMPPLDVESLGRTVPNPPIRVHANVRIYVQGSYVMVEGVSSVDGQKLTVTNLVRFPLDRLRRNAALDSLVAQAVLGALVEQKPCPFKTLLSGKVTFRPEPGSTVEGSYSGEADLTLRADGSFQGTMRIPESFVMTVSTPDGSCRITESGGSCTVEDETCTVTRHPGAARLEIRGQYHAQDAKLLFERMVSTSEQSGPDTITCPGGALPMPPMRRELLGNIPDLAVALADGAEVVVPPPAGWPGEYDVKLQIRYPVRAGRISRSPVPPPRVAARTR